MVLLTRIYTKGGDKGKTSLGTGERVLKSSVRIQAIGAVDSVNSSLGVAALSLTGEMLSDIRRIQNDLFDLGADLCMPGEADKLTVQETQVIWLEKRIDALNEALQPLTSFVLPGGSAASAYLHESRTRAREAERWVVELGQKESVSETVLRYLNRLSDYLFVAARVANKNGQEDVLWIPAQNQKDA